MIILKKVDEDNYRKVLDIKMPADQHFVAPNVVSLAQAWVYYDTARPYAIYNDDEIVGFIMLDYNYNDKKEAGVWRLMIAQEHQGKGYGTEAMKQAIEIIKKESRFNYIYLDYVPTNMVAKHVYEKLGFVATGEVDEGEIIMRLVIKKQS
ncbi:MAG: GNAT family N-acetyltransferase [Clostridia bacterium]